MRKEVLALHGLAEEPWPQLDLVNATPGAGKTQAMIRAAPIKRHRINFYLPTVAKADEVVEDYMAADGRMPIGGLSRPSAGAARAAQGRPADVWPGSRADQAGHVDGDQDREGHVRVCPMRFGCAHIEQKERLAG